MQKMTSKRLMDNLTGKETYAAIMQSYVDVMQQKTATFSDEAIDRAKAGIAKRPHDEREFYQWCNSKGVIDYLVAEIRVDAMQANWRLSLLTTSATYATLSTSVPYITPEMLQRNAQAIKPLLRKVSCYIAALSAFSSVLRVDLTPLLCGGINVLNEQLMLYGEMCEMFHNHLIAENEQIDSIAGCLPVLELESGSEIEALQVTLTEQLSHQHSNNFISVLEMLENSAVCVDG